MLYADRCRETTLSSGTGAIALLGAGTGYQSFNTAFGTGTTFPYCIAGQTSAEWEVGTGTLSAASTLVRSSVLASSNGGSLVNFSAGTKDVFCTLPAGLIVDPSTSQTLSNKSFATPVSITEAVGVSALTLIGATQTASTPVINATQTWNNGATAFTGIRLNVTDTASSAASLLADLQVGGSSKLSIDKAGNLTIAGSPTIQQTGYLHWTGRTYLLANADGNLTITNNAQTSQLKLLIAGNGQWQFGAADAAAPVAQVFSAQNVAAGTTDTAGANLTIAGSRGTGAGAGGAIIMQMAFPGTTGSTQNALSNALQMLTNGNYTFATSGVNLAISANAPTGFQSQIIVSGNGGTVTASVLCNPSQTFFSNSSGITTRSGTGDFVIQTSSGNTERLRIAQATGAITIAAPTSGTTLSVSTVTGNVGVSIAAVATDPTPALVVGVQGAGPAISAFPGIATFWQNSNTGQNAAVNIVDTLNGSGFPTTLNFFKSRNNLGSLGGGETIGQIQFAGADGTSFLTTGAITLVTDAAPSTGNMPTRMVFYTGLTNALVERLRINSTGNHTFAAASSGTTMQVTALAGQNAASFLAGPIKLASFTVAGLPAAATVGANARAFVTDGLAPTFMATVAGGGAVLTPVYSDGANWKVG